MPLKPLELDEPEYPAGDEGEYDVGEPPAPVPSNAPPKCGALLLPLPML